jgi:hypothetical protein
MVYDKCKDDEALIKSEILPVIESKINGDADQIGDIKNNLKEYIESYKRSVLADNFRNKENVEFSKNEDTLETYDFEFYTE